MVLELLLNGVAPAALLLRTPDVILSLGVIVAEEVRPPDTPRPAPPAQCFPFTRSTSQITRAMLRLRRWKAGGHELRRHEANSG